MAEETKEMTYEQQVALQKQYILEAYEGNVDVYDTDELQEKFEVIGFLAPYVAVKRKEDGVKGSLKFIDIPRVYYSFVSHEK